jgi:hypothetical protein
MEKEKPVYEKPRVLDLGPVTPAFGAICSNGGVAPGSPCRTGGTAGAGQCLTGTTPTASVILSPVP